MSRWQSELQAVEKQIQELEQEGMYVPRSLQERHKLIWQFVKTQEEKMVNYPPTAEPMGWASWVEAPTNVGNSR